MPRIVRDAKIDTRAARYRLPVNHEPHWRAINRGEHLGYRKGKRGGAWIARYRPDGGRYFKTVLGKADDTRDADGFAVLTYRQAQDKARDWFAEQARKAAKGEVGPDEPYTVADTMRDYLDWYAIHRKPSGLAFATYATNAHILPELGTVAVNALTTKKIETWHQALATTPARVRSGKFETTKYREAPSDSDGERARKATANRILIALRAALNRAFRNVENGIAGDAAWRRVERFEDVDAAKVRYLTAGECTRLVNACHADFRPLAQAALLTGTRYGELVAMECCDFNPDAGTVTVRNSKSGKPRHVPLTDEGVMLFGQLTAGREGRIFVKANGQPWARWQQRRPLAAAAKAVKLDGVTFHILRHTYASMLAMRGVPMSVIAAALGHSDTRMTEKHYAHLGPSYVAETIRAKFPALGLVKSDNVTPIRQQK